MESNETPIVVVAPIKPAFDPSNGVNIFLTIVAALYNLGLLVFSLLWLFTNKFENTKTSLTDIKWFEINEFVTYGLFFSGTLGGAFYCLRAIYSRLADTFTPLDGQPSKTPLNMKVWIFWYVYRPIEGGVLAVVLLLLIKSNLVQLKETHVQDVSSFYTIIGIGFLAGFGAHELIHKILEIIQVLFAKSKIKASNSTEKARENKGE
jgi:hypothetical protein